VPAGAADALIFGSHFPVNPKTRIFPLRRAARKLASWPTSYRETTQRAWTGFPLIHPPTPNLPMHGSPTFAQLDELAAVSCPCGSARRAFADQAELPATVHLTEINCQARVHYHRRHTEVYVVLRCDSGAAIELDGVLYPVKPYSSILIPPGVRHRGVGEMTVLIYCTPKFDPSDEYFDDPMPHSESSGHKA